MSNLSPSPLRSPEYLASIPPYEPPVPDPNRLCSSDGTCGHGAGGCRRTDTILAWEAENEGQYLPGNLVWGPSDKDQFFHHDGSIWYYKPYLLEKLDNRRSQLDIDKQDQNFLSFVESLKILDPNFNLENDVFTLDDVRAVISSQPAGMPVFVKETNNFFQFEDTGVEYITIDNISKDDLINLQSLSSGNNWASSFALCTGLIKVNNIVYNTNLLNWQTTSSDPSVGIVFSNATDINFYSFASETDLSSEVKQAILDCGNYFTSQLGKSFKIVYL
jgi:hypothetical protein